MNVIDSPRARLGANALIGVIAVQGVLTVANGFLSGLTLELLGFEAWRLANTVAWTATDLALMTSLFVLAGGLAREDAGIVKATALAFLVSIGFDLVMLVLERGAAGAPAMLLVTDANILAVLIIRALMLVMFARLAGPSRPWVLPVVGLLGVLTIARTGYLFASVHQLLPVDVAVRSSTRLVFSGLTFVTTVGVLACGFGLRGALTVQPSVQAVVAASGLRPPDAAPVNAGTDFLVGAVLLALGLGVTFISYSAASGGSRYLVATGAIGSGIGMLLRGVWRLRR
jgi:hypothetical protein